MFIVTICKQKHPSCQLPQLPQFLKGKINLQNTRCCMYGYDKRTAKGFALMSPTTPLPHLHWCRYILLDELKVCDILDHVTCAEQPVMSVPVSDFQLSQHKLATQPPLPTPLEWVHQFSPQWLLCAAHTNPATAAQPSVFHGFEQDTREYLTSWWLSQKQRKTPKI